MDSRSMRPIRQSGFSVMRPAVAFHDDRALVEGIADSSRLKLIDFKVERSVSIRRARHPVHR